MLNKEYFQVGDIVCFSDPEEDRNDNFESPKKVKIGTLLRISGTFLNKRYAIIYTDKSGDEKIVHVQPKYVFLKDKVRNLKRETQLELIHDKKFEELQEEKGIKETERELNEINDNIENKLMQYIDWEELLSCARDSDTLKFKLTSVMEISKDSLPDELPCISYGVKISAIARKGKEIKERFIGEVPVSSGQDGCLLSEMACFRRINTFNVTTNTAMSIEFLIRTQLLELRANDLEVFFELLEKPLFKLISYKENP